MRITQRRRNRTRRQEVAELNITAFMNLMVVLVPFLLITAVFTRTAILQLNVPAADNQQAEQPAPRPQISLYTDRIEWTEGETAPQVSRRYKDQRELSALRKWLITQHQLAPDQTEALLLIAADVKYESLIAVMDHIRHYPTTPNTEVALPLYTDISFGDAP